MLILKRLYFTSRGLTYLSLWENETNYLWEVKLQNMLHSSSFSLLHLQKTFYKFQASLLSQINLFSTFPFSTLTQILEPYFEPPNFSWVGWLVGWLVVISYIYGTLTLMTKMEHGPHYCLSWPYLLIIAFVGDIC